MKTCIFDDIVIGKIPCYRVGETDEFLAFLDIFPKTKGHTLIIPKKHFRWVYDIENSSEYWKFTISVTNAIKSALSPVWINYFTYGAIEHAHMHILPRYETMNLNDENDIVPSKNISFSKEEFVSISKAIFDEFTKQNKS